VAQQDLREQNRRSWNAVVPVHESHRHDQALFFRRGGSTLFEDERVLLGDLANLAVAHLFCNAGQDTLSLAQLGARVTGVDLSDVAIGRARDLSAESGLAATFVCADVFDWLAQTVRSSERFDVIYCSYGALCWINDLPAWARAVAQILKLGGRCVIIEFHPVSNMFDVHWNLTRSYPMGGTMLQLPGVGDYVGAARGGLSPSGYAQGVADFDNPEPCFLFQWSVGETVTALADAGLLVRTLREYLHINGERPFERMDERPGRRMYAPSDVAAIPLMYGVVAQRIEVLDGY
jgi:SAM-dependent methyltransferase